MALTYAELLHQNQILTIGLTMSNAEKDILTRDLATAKADRDIARAAESLAKATRDKAVIAQQKAEAEVAWLKANWEPKDSEPDPDPDPDPDPQPKKTRYGACPNDSKLAEIPPMYGPECDGRGFDSAKGISYIHDVPSTMKLVHVSWKDSSTPINDTTVGKCLANLPPKSKYTIEHEHDVKHKKAIKAANKLTNSAQRQAALVKADAELTNRLNRAKTFYAIAHRIRPDLDSVDVIAAGRIMPSWGDSANGYVGLTGARVLGIDCDGATGDINWPECIPRAQQIADAMYNGRWTIPEYALDGVSNRLAQYKEQIPKFVAAGVEEIYIYSAKYFPGTQLNATELAWWKSLCNTND